MSSYATGNYTIKSVRKLDIFEGQQRYLITTTENKEISVSKNTNMQWLGQNIDVTGWSKIQEWVSQGNIINEAE